MSLEKHAIRDQAASAISAILMRLCESSSALAVALVDAEGETVDYAGRLSPFDTRVAAAEWRLVLSLLEDSRVPEFRSTHELLIKGRGHSFAVRSLTDGYALVFVLPRHFFSISRRALAEAVHELEIETNLSLVGRHDGAQWLRVEVRTAARNEHRPEAVWYEGGWRRVTIVGRFQSHDLARREVGYLTRLPTGAELLLVREPLGRWFAGRPR
jgi:hypothetical protein